MEHSHVHHDLISPSTEYGILPGGCIQTPGNIHNHGHNHGHLDNHHNNHHDNSSPYTDCFRLPESYINHTLPVPTDGFISSTDYGSLSIFTN